MMRKGIYLVGLALMAMTSAEAKKKDGIVLTYNGNKVTVVNNLKDSAEVVTDGARVTLNSQYKNPITIRMKGQSDDGMLVLKSAGRVALELDGVNLTSKEGAPLWLKNKKRVEIVAVDGTNNSLTVEACQDTANYKAAVIFVKENAKLSGKGTLNVIAEGKGCKGITTKGDLTIDDLTLNVETKGDNWNSSRGKFGGMGGFGGFGGGDGEGGFGGFGGFGGGFPGFGGGEFNPDSIPDFGGGFPGGGFGGPRGGFGPRDGEELPDSLRERRGRRGRGGFGGPRGGFGGFGGGEFNPDSIPDFGGGFPGFGGGFGGFGGEGGTIPPFGGGGGHGNPKGISAAGNLTINSGNITVKTAFHGGEGLESKQVLTINGGNIDIDVIDDGINCAKQIVVNGGKIITRSSTNDAIDCNGNKEALIFNGGTIYAWSSTGSPEEGIDSDFVPIQINGGRIFSMGGGMMGDEPSKPNNETSKQPSILLVGLEMQEGVLVEVYEGTAEKLGKKIDSFKAPFNLARCSSLISYPEFKVGNSYVVKIGDKTEEFTLNENYNTNAKEGNRGGFGGGWGGFGGGFGGFGGPDGDRGPRGGDRGPGPRGGNRGPRE